MFRQRVPPSKIEGPEHIDLIDTVMSLTIGVVELLDLVLELAVVVLVRASDIEVQDLGLVHVLLMVECIKDHAIC